MLTRAQERVESEQLRNVDALLEMDAAHLDLPDNTFNTVVAMFVMTVVPNPDKVMAELERVCAPGGEVMIVKSSQPGSWRARLGRAQNGALRRPSRLAPNISDRARDGQPCPIAD